VHWEVAVGGGEEEEGYAISSLTYQQTWEHAGSNSNGLSELGR